MPPPPPLAAASSVYSELVMCNRTKHRNLARGFGWARGEREETHGPFSGDGARLSQELCTISDMISLVLISCCGSQTSCESDRRGGDGEKIGQKQRESLHAFYLGQKVGLGEEVCI